MVSDDEVVAEIRKQSRRAKQVVRTLIQNLTSQLKRCGKFVNIRTRKVQSQESS